MAKGRPKGSVNKKPSVRARCSAIEPATGEQCERFAMTKGMCDKHYQRWKRHGTVDVKSPTMSQAAQNRKKPVAYVEGLCMCTHSSKLHFAGQRAKCKVESCDCKQFSEVNEMYLRRQARTFREMGFAEHIGENATCTVCFESIAIGRWHEPETLGRARLHRRRECKGANSAVVQRG